MAAAETALTESRPNGLAAQGQVQAPSLIQIIGQMAMNPAVDPDKMLRILEMQERLERRSALIAYNDSIRRVEARLEPILKRGRREVKGVLHNKFAKWEDVMEVIGPILLEEGLTFSSDSKPADRGWVQTIGRLSHSQGHWEERSVTFPPDEGGSKNKIQEVVSAVSYGKRTTFGMLINFVTKDEDDDGQAGSKSMALIGEREVQQIEDMFAAIELSEAGRKGFFDLAGVGKVSEIRGVQYQGLMSQLEAKLRSKRAGK